MDSSKTIAQSTRRFFSGTLISRITGFAREVAMAALFGTTPAVAAFWMAFRFAHLLRRLFGEGALNTAFVPHFERLRGQDAQKGARFFYDLSASLTILLLLITVSIIAILGCCLFFLDLSHSIREVIRLTILMLPALTFLSLYALNTSLLNCERSYFLPSVAPAFVNLTWLVAISFLWRFDKRDAMQYLAMVVVFAFAVQWVVTMPAVYRFLTRELGRKWWQGHRFSYREILRILRPFLLGIIGVTATQINSALDAIFARIANPEGPAFLWYAIRIQQLPLALFGLGLTGALLPPISRAFQSGDKKQADYFLRFALHRALILMLPLTAALFVLGFTGINLVYGRGAFSGQAVVETTLCLWAYGAGLFPVTTVLIFASAFYAQKNYRLPTLLALITVGLNIVLNSWFVFGLGMGAVSVALATTISATVNSALLAFFLKKQQGLSFERLGGSCFKVVVGCVVAVLATVFITHFAYGSNTWRWLMGQPLAPFPTDLLTQLKEFALAAACFGIFIYTYSSSRIGISATRKLP